MSDSNYITVYGWMVSDLHLSGNELLLYALVAGYPDGWYGSYSTAAKRIGIERRNTIAVFQRLERKGLVEVVTNHHHTQHYKVVTNHHQSSDETSPAVVMKHHQSGDETSPNNKDIINIDNKPILKGDNTKKRFKKPTIDEVKSYIKEKGWSVDAERWYAHYEANGWMVGRSKMKDWKAAIKTWQYSQFNINNTKSASYESRKFTARETEFCGCDTIGA